MQALETVVLLQMATAPRSTNANDVDQFYQTQDHGNPRFLLPFISMAAVIHACLPVRRLIEQPKTLSGHCRALLTARGGPNDG